MISMMYSLLSHRILLILMGLVMGTVAESQMIAQKCQSVYNWIHGPFVYNKDHNCDSLQGFMNSNILHNVSIINEILELDSDEPSTVIFEANQGLPFPMEIRWAEFRGNMKLIRLGDNSKSLVLHDGESNVQISSVGHLFVVMKPVNMINDNWFSLDANHEEHVELITNINQIVGMYIVSSRNEMPVKLGLDQRAFLNVEELMRITGTVCVDYRYQDTIISDTISNPNLKVCIKAMLLTYWEHQRLSQVPVYTWAVPTIPTVSSYTTTTTNNSDISYEYYSNDKNINKDGNNNTKNNINDAVSTRALWTTKHLTDDFTRSIVDWHRTHRGTDMSHPEPPISLVFNQLEAPTYYTPLSDELHQLLVDEVHHMVADWLGVEKEGLEVTGAYSSREYRQGAVVRWHVDPVETQPITAIVHIGSSSGSMSRRSCCCIHTTTTNYSDSCTVGTSTFTKNHHDYSYSTSKEYSIENSNIATEPQCTEYNYSSNHSKSSRPWSLQVPKSLSQFITYNISSQATAHISHNMTEHIYDPEMLYNINIQPGEVLLLQSSKLPHARLVPLQDEWYTNAFVHFRPKEWMHQDIIHSLLR